MKIVAVSKDFSVRVSAHSFVQYREGREYPRVPEAHAKAIVEADAGVIIKKDRSE